MKSLWRQRRLKNEVIKLFLENARVRKTNPGQSWVIVERNDFKSSFLFGLMLRPRFIHEAPGIDIPGYSTGGEIVGTLVLIAPNGKYDVAPLPDWVTSSEKSTKVIYDSEQKKYMTENGVEIQRAAIAAFLPTGSIRIPLKK